MEGEGWQEVDASGLISMVTIRLDNDCLSVNQMTGFINDFLLHV